MRRIGGVVLTVTGLLACPSHLIITLPLLILLLAGTALGSFLSRNTGLVTTFAGIYFVVASDVGYWFLFGKSRPKRKVDAACPNIDLSKSRRECRSVRPYRMSRLQRGDNSDDDLTTRML